MNFLLLLNFALALNFYAPFLIDTTLHMCFTKVKSCCLDKLQQEITDLDFGDNFIDNCDYLDHDEFKEVTINRNDLSIIQINIRGIINKQAELSKVLNTSNKKKIDIAILSETWLSDASKLKVNIPGYDFLGEQRTTKKGGGVGILINNELKYKA